MFVPVLLPCLRGACLFPVLSFPADRQGQIDAPDPVNDMLRGLAGEGFQVQGDTTPHLRKLRGRVSQRLGLAQNPADFGERRRCKA